MTDLPLICPFLVRSAVCNLDDAQFSWSESTTRTSHAVTWRIVHGAQRTGRVSRTVRPNPCRSHKFHNCQLYQSAKCNKAGSPRERGAVWRHYFNWIIARPRFHCKWRTTTVCVAPEWVPVCRCRSTIPAHNEWTEAGTAHFRARG